MPPPYVILMPENCLETPFLARLLARLAVLQPQTDLELACSDLLCHGEVMGHRADQLSCLLDGNRQLPLCN